MTLAALFCLQCARLSVALERWRYDIRRREIVEEHLAAQQVRYLTAWDAVADGSPYQ